jgi:hypothetical protein
MLHGEILNTIRRVDSSYPASNLTKYLSHLRGEQRCALVRRGKDGKYRFSEPLLHVFAQAMTGSRRIIDDDRTYRVLVESWRSSELHLYLTGDALGGIQMLDEPPPHG